MIKDVRKMLKQIRSKFSRMNEKNILVVLLILILIPFTAGAEIVAEINIQDSFSLGEILSFNYSIISGVSLEITFIPYIECPTAPVAPLDKKSATLDPNIVYRETYKSMVVEDFIEPQTCTAYVQILEPYQKTVSKDFSITTDPSFSFNIKLDKKIFLQNENIYIDYNSEVSNPSITATLTYPDKSTKQITLPSSIKASKIGTYELDVTASKQGYKTITQKTQFGVIEKQADIKTISAPDLSKFVVSDKTKTRNLIIMGLLIGIIIVVLIILSIFPKRKRSGLVKQIQIS